MQTIEHSLHNIHPIFDDIEQLYRITSERSYSDNALVKYEYNDAFRALLRAFEEYGGINYRVSLKKSKYERIRTPRRKKTVLLCYSGGKDSTATALWYKEHGYKVYLYHVKGINLTYKDEWKTVEKLAEKLDMPLIIENVKLKGKQEWIEHPMKNMIVANMALQYGIKNKLTAQVAFGNFSSSSLDTDPFDVCGGDCREMWEAYNEIIQTVIPSFEMHTPLTNMQDTLDILMKHKDIAVLCQSCIGPYRYRDYLGKNNRLKYKLDLPEHRCFSCWKCCLEYIVYADNDIYEYNEEMYKHCLQILKKTIKTEQGITVKLDDVWEHYFFYSKDRSKYYG